MSCQKVVKQMILRKRSYQPSLRQIHYKLWVQLFAMELSTTQVNGVEGLEEGVGKPLQWLICLLHANELPFRKYMSVVDDGCTTGPSSSTGEISMALNFDPKDSPIVNFKPIDEKVIDVSNDVMTDLSTDQIYLLKACLAVQQGYTVSEHIPFLQTAMPGNLSNSR